MAWDINMSFKSSVRKITLVAVLLALSTNVAGQYTSKTQTNTSSTKQLESIVHNSTSDIYNKVKDTIYYNFNDRNLILDQYTNIPVRNEHNPVYEKLLFDKTNRYFCYVFPRTYDGLRKAFRKSHAILEKNNADEFGPVVNIITVPGAPTEIQKGSVHKDNTLGYIALDLALSSGLGNIHREWDVYIPTDIKGYTIEAEFDNKKYEIRIYTGIKKRDKK